MARPADKDRLIWLLQEEGRSSNRNVRSALNLTDKRYAKIKQELLDEGLIEKVKGQGGGVQLTRSGMNESTLPEAASSVAKEKHLYGPFVDILDAESKENEEPAVVVDTSALRRSGKWSNPDVTKISIRKFPILRTHKILLTTYELKQWKRWNVDSVFEAASQRRFAHEAYVVLEWAKTEPVVGLDEMIAVCSRFGVGLLTLRPYYGSYRYDVELDAEKHAPTEDYVEEYLGYVFEKYNGTKDIYESLCETYCI
ncbi:hypothetical protein [Paraburkholderia megapolitana]|uniref:Winged helix-turn-helix domain-containing protein n=1 Tax=Paraburkholderia megapolitana TaxID=420953 RepID=A0A1I3VX88_9BURK|nr:hypothetical protein [Paraburkholderia megapolitana]QDQ82267.1 hypothetical protein FNZ07_13310 [Paraburkholderia megapolitana]SFJ99573.1 hypothetical protein SAMN05192543_11518 [Paraburkholderia megapolitana]